MLGDETMLAEFGVPVDSWNRHATTYKGLLRRRDLPGNPKELADLRAADIAEWERSAAVDDGVQGIDHIVDHARIRRMGSGCACMLPGGATRVQKVRTALVKRSREIDLALANARADTGKV